MEAIVAQLYTVYWGAIVCFSAFAATLLFVAIRHALTRAW